MIVGLTGGIGSGKTTVAEIFQFLGVPVYEADHFAKSIIDTDIRVQSRLQALLGIEIVKEGKIDRPLMASIIFNDPKLLEATNSIIHPAVAKHFKAWLAKQNVTYIIREAAILFESGSYRDCDKIITVTAPQELRIERVMSRSKISREEVLARMDKQWGEEEKVKRSHFVVQNDNSRSLIKQVLKKK